MGRVTTEKIDLAAITCREVERYVGYSPMATLYPIFDHKRKIYAVIVVDTSSDDVRTWVMLMARIVKDCIVIDEDTTDKSLVDALVVNGRIPREQIVLAYAGETLPQDSDE